MIQSDITHELMKAAEEYPVVTIFGPRQSGKTTLAQKAFPHKPYVSLDMSMEGFWTKFNECRPFFCIYRKLWTKAPIRACSSLPEVINLSCINL